MHKMQYCNSSISSGVILIQANLAQYQGYHQQEAHLRDEGVQKCLAKNNKLQQKLKMLHLLHHCQSFSVYQ